VQPDETDQFLRIAGCRRVSQIWNGYKLQYANLEP
jgi:hypothetical protein